MRKIFFVMLAALWLGASLLGAVTYAPDRNRGISFWQKTNADGVLEFSRDLFLQQEYPAQKVFITVADDARNADTPLFAVEAPLPAGTDEICDVNISAKPLEVRLALPRGLAEFAGRNMKIHFGTSYGLYGSVSGDLALPVTEQVRLAALQPNKYLLNISMPGAKR